MGLTLPALLGALLLASAAHAEVPALRGAVVAGAGAPARLQAGPVVLDIAAGAVAQPTRLSVTELAASEVAPLAPGMTNVTRGGSAFRFGPHGSHFLRNLTLTLPFDAARLPGGTTAADVRAFYFDDSRGCWEPLDRVAVDPASATVVSLTDHFTDIIAATLVTPTEPEVASYVPTTMTDMKAADPSQGVQLIQPPEPGPMGDARLSFPIDLPPGRNGMQPQLAITYQSEGGNGWLGVGWGLDVPSLSVDTRWGVPRYGRIPDANGAIGYRNVETESYLMDGQPLTPLANRGPFVERTGDLKTFHTRIESGFDRILRHGDRPENFWWEVVDKYGTRSFYGDVPGTGGGPATLRDDAGDVYRWALREVRDPSGNALHFDYDLVTDTGNAESAVQGRQLYLRAINYTGTDDGGGYTPGPYAVRFLRDSDVGGARRPDVQIDYRGGFKQVTADRLREVRVELNGAPVRAYVLEYETGAFDKSRLARIRVRGADGTVDPARDHRFTYYDDVRDASGAYVNGFAPEASWTMPDDAISLCNDLGPLTTCPSSFAVDFDRASAMSGAITHSIGGHLYLGLNCGLPTKLNSAGVKTGFNLTRTSVNLGLFDVNGDNLPDKVFRSGNQFMYRANEARPGGTRAFSAQARPLGNLDAISVETGVSASAGVEQYFLGTTAIADGSATLTVGSTYTTDANGDGLLDVVRDGEILYSHPDAAGDPVFENTSANTPLPLAPGALDGDGLIQDYEPLFQDLLDQHPLQDVFRRWIAPYDGMVRISGGVALQAPQETVDGVRVSIQHNGTVLWSDLIAKDDATIHDPTGTATVAVRRGDRLYFRVQSVFDGAMDAVDWNPTIDYEPLVAARDVNGRNPLHFVAAEDFILAGRASEARVPFEGDVHLSGTFVKRDTTTDDVVLTVLQNDAELMRTVVPWDSTGEFPVDLGFHVAGDDTTTTDVNEADRLAIRLVVDSPIDAALVGWRDDAPPEVVYESGATGLTAQADQMIRFFVPFDMDLYPADDLILPQRPWVATVDAPFTVRTRLGGDWTFKFPGVADPVRDGELIFTIKRRDRPVAKTTLEVQDGAVQNRTVDVSGVARGDTLFFDVSMRHTGTFGDVAADVETPGPARDDPAAEPDLKAGTGGPHVAAPGATVNVPVALHRDIPYDDVPTLGRGLFGQPYRGWSYAGYNGNPPRDSPERPHACDGTRTAPTDPIDESLLTVDAGLGDVDQNTDPADLQEALAAQKAYVYTPLWERLPDGTLRGSWRGPDQNGWIGGRAAGSTRLGTASVGVPCGSDIASGTDSRAVPRIGASANAGVGAGFIIAISATAGTAGGDLDFVDLNGDQFPDITGNGRAQYTLPDGGLEQKSRAIGFAAVRRTNTTAASVSLGGSIPISTGGSRGTVAAKNNSAPRGERTDNLMPSLGFSGSLGGGTAKVKADLVDINGDGLPDRVHDDGTVSLNTGYAFADPEPWPGLAEVEKATSLEFSLGADLGFNDLIYGFAGGLSYSREESHTSHTLVDMNGDGQVDRVRDDGGTLWVGFNTGTGFAPDVPWRGADVDDVARAASASLGAGGYFTVGIPVFACTPVTPLFLIINPGAYVSGAMARQEAALMDVDGDGRADYVQSERDDEFKVASNGTGRTNLLASVERPLGGRFTLDYARAGNVPGLPQSTWTLARVDLYDGVDDDGPSPLETTFAYGNPNFDRGEREFLGFGQVREEQREGAGGPVYRTIARTYRNDSYYAKGLLATETTEDAGGHPLRRTTNTFAFRDVETGTIPVSLASRTATIFPMVAETRIETIEDGASIESRRTFEYDASGNISHVTDYGDPGPDDDLEADITYGDCPASGVTARPTRIVVSSNGHTLAEREATLDCATGNTLQVREVLADGSHADTDMTYDAHGLVTSVTGPPNLHGERYARTFEYDPLTSTQPVRIEDSYGLVSRAAWDPRFALPTSTTDASGNAVSYTYDAFGRTTSVTGPYEQGTGHPSITFDYDIAAPVPWARTRHFDVLHPSDPIEAVLFTDGLGRVLETKTDATLHDAPGGAARDVMVVSGRNRYDALGRSVEQYQPVPEPAGAGTLFNPTFDAVPPTRIAWDALDRPVEATDPDGSVTRYRYAVAPVAGGAPRLETTVTDANGGSQSSYRDARDLLAAVREGKDAWTSYRYDALDRLVAVRDAAGNETRMTYDALGRRVALERPDAGVSRYAYDPAGNLVARTTASLGDSRPITYDYAFGRLTAVHYPLDPANDVAYAYGDPGTPNAAGRLVRITDTVGEEQLGYGKLGEVVRQVRSITGHGGGSQATDAYTTGYRYDTWGRLLEITYPDGEVVTYGYDAGGRVRSVGGVDGACVTPYLRDMEYDVNQQQTYMELGNGVRTTFRYRPEDQRLVQLTSVLKGAPFQNLRYTYDDVGNLTSLVNDVPVASPSGFGGPTEERFAYDSLYRLTHATGTYEFAPHKRDAYTLTLGYDAIHNLVSKNQSHEIATPSGQEVPQHGTSYAFDYRYDAARPHAPAHVGDRALSFDATGNQTGWTSDHDGTRRTVTWDEEDRVRSIAVQGHTMTYAYDSRGARVLKRGPGGETAYVNQFLSVRNGQIVTKHIYVGDTRLCSILSHQTASERGPPVKERDVYYYHPDQLGSTQFVTDGTGAVREHRRYFPTGEPWIEEWRGQQVTDLQFGAREYDSETGLYYFGARYYDPVLGQFLSADPMSAAPASAADAWSPPALNVYAYAYDNPVRLVDPSGRAPSFWSRLKQTAAFYRGAIGRSLGGGGGAGILRFNDSPVRAGAAAGSNVAVAGAGVGVFASDASTSARLDTRRELGATGERAPPGARGPPATEATTPAAGKQALPPIVLGENMAGRVIPYAKRIGAETIVDWLAGREWSQQLNDDYIAHIRSTGRLVLDIGPDFPRRLRFHIEPPTDRGPRPVYESERQLLRGYSNYVQLFKRTGKFQGGVAGFDPVDEHDDGVSGLKP